MDSRTKLLLGILALVALLAVWTWIGPGGSSSEESAAPHHAAARPAVEAPVPVVEEPRFAALAVRHVESRPGRDPWRFGAAPQPTRFVRPPVPPPSLEPAPVVQPPPAAHIAAAPEPPVFPWTYLGSFGPADRRIAVFAESAAPGAPVQNRREGEIVAERFVLERIGIESVDVRPLSVPGAPAQRLVPGAAPGRRET